MKAPAPPVTTPMIPIQCALMFPSLSLPTAAALGSCSALPGFDNVLVGANVRRDLAMKTVDVLYFDGCPNVDVAMDHARKAVAAVGNGAEVRLVRVEGDEEAVRQQFLGSPTVRVDGLDVDVAARPRAD